MESEEVAPHSPSSSHEDRAVHSHVAGDFASQRLSRSPSPKRAVNRPTVTPPSIREAPPCTRMVAIASKSPRLRHKVAAAVEPLRLCGGFHCNVETSLGCFHGHAMITEESRHVCRSPPLTRRTGRASMVAATSPQRYDHHRCHTTVNTRLFSRPLRIPTSPSRNSL